MAAPAYSGVPMTRPSHAPGDAPWHVIAAQIASATGQAFALQRTAAVGGGCINSTCRIAGSGREYFVKLNSAGRASMFEAEAAGLAEIARTNTLRVPLPVCHGRDESASWLVLEYIEMGGGGAAAMHELGRGLARMHRVTTEHFGWTRDNTIGATPQINAPMASWPEFWRARRLGRQLRLAAQNGYGGALQARGEQLLAKIDAFFTGYRPQPSLLHGDLWGGNAGFDRRGTPVVYDPAVYYGDRESDLAMTELFGGFGAEFYRGYAEEWPLDAGYTVRRDLYNLYHVLNHANLFGGGYARQAERMIERLLAAT